MHTLLQKLKRKNKVNEFAAADLLVDKSLLTREIIPYFFAKQHNVSIKTIEDHLVTIWHTSITTMEALVELRRYFSRPLQTILISAEEFQQRLMENYQANNNTSILLADLKSEIKLEDYVTQLNKHQDILEQHDDAPIINLLNTLLHQAIQKNASDIHLETFRQTAIIRYRIDGQLQTIIDIPTKLAPRLVTRIKVMSSLNIAEKRLPQEGRITLRIADHEVDVRVSVVPTYHGERIVLRILDKNSARLELTSLGMSSSDLTIIQQLIQKPHGILLVTGPTGSGKTTSLYAMLNKLNQIEKNILTIEDPIEYDLPGIGQMQVNEAIDMTFAKGLRAILRQDPDIIMIGEIRDIETAEIAIHASLTGHLVLSTLHTNTAVGAITRLRDMGIAEFLLSSSLIGILSQRLIRKLCEHCKRKKEIESEITYEAVGCEACQYLGYRGRQAIFEIVVIDDHLRSLIHDKASEITLTHYVRQFSMSLEQAASELIKTGVTDWVEVKRVI